MSIVTITLTDKNFQLSCSEESKERLINLGEKLNSEIKKIKDANSSASFDLLLVMTALNLQNELEKMTKEQCGEILERSKKDFQSLLSLVGDELKTVVKKLK